MAVVDDRGRRLMPDLLAKGTAATVAALLVAVIGVLIVTSSPPAGARQVTAEFDDAFPLIEGMHVRVDGAIAGSVAEIDVNDSGNAEVVLTLTGSVPEPRGDASAAIRQQDTTGDSYVAFDPGGDPGDPRSAEPLGEEGISCTDHETCPGTLVAPRLDDLLNAFGPSERAGVQLILVELAKSLDRRGRGLNRAALELRPALAEANQALAEVGEQNAALKSLIRSAESVTGQAARRKRRLGRMIESLAAITNVTAAESAALDAGLERLPETARRAETTLAALTRAALAARPLATQLEAGAPDLALSLERLPGFLGDASAWIEDTTPTLELTRKLLRAAEPTLRIGKRRIVTGPFDLTGATADLLNAVLGGEDAFPALFGDDSYGEGEGTLGRRGFGAVAVEPGDLPGYPASHEPRNWLRVSAVLNCEVFGRPVEPGCLADELSGAPLPTATQREPALERLARRIRKQLETSSRRGGANGSRRSGRLPDLKPPDLELPGRGPGARESRGDRGGKGARGKGPDARLEGLLDYLLR